MKPIANTHVDLGKHIWVLWAVFATVALTATGTDPDLWGHVRFGLDWWRTRSLPTVDPYSFTQDRPWINHEWLSEALMGGAYALGDTTGLILLKMAILVAALFVLSRRLRGCTASVAVAVLSLAIICVIPTSLTVRPQLWSVLGLVLLFVLVDREAPPTPRQMVAGAALFALWANLHGGWITGAATLAVYIAARLVRERRQIKAWVALAAAAALGTLLNPYGIGLWRFLAATVRSTRPDITEWAPLTLRSPVILWIPIAAAFVIAFALSRAAAVRPKLEVWAVLVLLGAGAIRVSRVASLIGPATLVLLAPGICRAWGQRGRFVLPGAGVAIVLWIPAVVALAAAAAPAARAFACLPIAAEWTPDLRAAASLRGATGRLLTAFDWGEYAIWHFGPRLQVSIDGRRETVYSDSVVEWHRAFERNDPDAQKIVAQFSPEYVWLRSSNVGAKQWLAANGYRIDVDTGGSFVAVRQDRPQLTAPVTSMDACFP